MLEYKAALSGVMLVAVPAAYTSQECGTCDHPAAANRKTQSLFDGRERKVARHDGRCRAEVRANCRCRGRHANFDFTFSLKGYDPASAL